MESLNDCLAQLAHAIPIPGYLDIELCSFPHAYSSRFQSKHLVVLRTQSQATAQQLSFNTSLHWEVMIKVTSLNATGLIVFVK